MSNFGTEESKVAGTAHPSNRHLAYHLHVQPRLKQSQPHHSDGSYDNMSDKDYQHSDLSAS